MAPRGVEIYGEDVRLDPGAGACALGRPHRHRRVPGDRQQLRPCDCGIRRDAMPTRTTATTGPWWTRSRAGDCTPKPASDPEERPPRRPHGRRVTVPRPTASFGMLPECAARSSSCFTRRCSSARRCGARSSRLYRRSRCGSRSRLSSPACCSQVRVSPSSSSQSRPGWPETGWGCAGSRWRRWLCWRSRTPARGWRAASGSCWPRESCSASGSGLCGRPAWRGSVRRRETGMPRPSR